MKLYRIDRTGTDACDGGILYTADPYPGESEPAGQNVVSLTVHLPVGWEVRSADAEEAYAIRDGFAHRMTWDGTCVAIVADGGKPYRIRPTAMTVLPYPRA